MSSAELPLHRCLTFAQTPGCGAPSRADHPIGYLASIPPAPKPINPRDRHRAAPRRTTTALRRPLGIRFAAFDETSTGSLHISPEPANPQKLTHLPAVPD